MASFCGCGEAEFGRRATHVPTTSGVVVHTEQGVMAFGRNSTAGGRVPIGLTRTAKAAAAAHRHSLWLPPSDGAGIDIFGQ